MSIGELGEFGLIDRLQQIIASDHPDVIVGVGDDAAVLADRDDELLLATVDSHVENIHFLPFLTSPAQTGRRALVVNLSDIAAMGGRPQFALVSLALPANTSTNWIEECYRGMRTEADHSGVVIVGGNITRSSSGVFIDITVLGRVRREHLLLRSGAQPGDRLLVTGPVGDAYAGLQLVFNPRLPVAPDIREKLISRYMEPQPRLPEAAVIAHSRQASAMIDVSDGLSGDIAHICERSSVGVRVYAEHLPISPEARQVAEALNTPAWQLALEGGDDYGLCFTAPLDAVAALKAAVAQQTGTQIAVIGEILPSVEGRRLVLPDSREIPFESDAWQHFGAS
jgi:thiamine-monophosphate kinase